MIHRFTAAMVAHGIRQENVVSFVDVAVIASIILSVGLIAYAVFFS